MPEASTLRPSARIERYEADLNYLEREILLVEAEGRSPVLLQRLKIVLGEMRRNLRLFDVYEISRFH